MIKTKNKHGGAGRGQGRKPVDDKAMTLSVYPKKSRIESMGIDRAKEVAIQAIEKEHENILKKY